MNCQSCNDRMADLADGRLDGSAAAPLRAHIDGCVDCCNEFETISRTLRALDALPVDAPSHRLRAGVMGAIETEKLTLKNRADWASSIRRAAESRQGSRAPWVSLLLQLTGACALIVLGFVAGERKATERQVADLSARVDSMGQLVEQSVLQKRATGDRVETVLTAATLKPEAPVLDGLINSMAFDASVNVRLSALNALYAHADQDFVRAAVLACLPREPNPLVQVSMIDFLVGARAREASPELRKLVVDTKANVDVRESARRAIDQL